MCTVENRPTLGICVYLVLFRWHGTAVVFFSSTWLVSREFYLLFLSPLLLACWEDQDDVVQNQRKPFAWCVFLQTFFSFWHLTAQRLPDSQCNSAVWVWNETGLKQLSVHHSCRLSPDCLFCPCSQHQDGTTLGASLHGSSLQVPDRTLGNSWLNSEEESTGKMVVPYMECQEYQALCWALQTGVYYLLGKRRIWRWLAIWGAFIPW